MSRPDRIDAAPPVACCCRSKRHPLLPPSRDLVRVGSRRWFLQTGLAGLAGLSLADTLRLSAQGATAGTSTPTAGKKSVILFWLSGGPSHIDMWDPKPDAPAEIRGPYRPISTKVPGIQVCEHLPLQAKIMDKLSIIRSVDCSASNHTPITMQAGNPLARRTDDGNDGGGYPSMGSVAAKFRGANVPGMPPFVALADSLKADVWGAGQMGNRLRTAARQGTDRPAGHAARESTSTVCRTATNCGSSSTGSSAISIAPRR